MDSQGKMNSRDRFQSVQETAYDTRICQMNYRLKISNHPQKETKFP